MIATIQKGFLSGKIPAISSKSYAHRLLIAAALADRPTTVRCATVSEDILTASRVLKAMGASVERTDDGFIVEPVSTQPAYCGESGTIERFILPVACALGLDASITGPSGLSSRSTRNSATTASNSRRRAYFRSKPKDASRRATTPSRPTFRRSSSAACSSRCRSCRARAR